MFRILSASASSPDAPPVNHQSVGAFADELVVDVYYDPNHANTTSGAEAVDLEHGYGEGQEHYGVHVVFPDLYASLVFLSATYIVGFYFSRFLAIPSLVGEILVGILMGPNLLDLVPDPESFVLLGEIGLIFMVMEAGIDIDLTTLQLVGTRGTMIALVGTALPVCIATGIAYGLGYDMATATAVGCVFGPTSHGIAMAVLRRYEIL